MKLDPTKMKDWQIAEAAEKNMKPIGELAAEIGLEDDELLPMGRLLGKVDYINGSFLVTFGPGSFTPGDVEIPT